MPPEAKTTYSTELVTWAAIAGHLGVSVREAQSWEHELSLPIYRLPGKKSRVWAYAEELEIWKEGAAQKPSAGPAAGPSPERRDLGIVVPGRARFALVLAGILLGMGALWSWLKPQLPASYRATEAGLVALDERDREVWRYDAGAPLYLPYYSSTNVPDPTVWVKTREGPSPDALFFKPWTRAAEKMGIPLDCLSLDGKRRWRFTAGRTVRDSRSSFSPIYLVNAFKLFSDERWPERIAVTSVHQWSYPDQVAVLDDKGTLLGEYWHAGHLLEIEMADLDGDGRSEILAGGEHDGYRQATLVVLDADRVKGASMSPAANHTFVGEPTGFERAVVLFPRSALTRDAGTINRVAKIATGPVTITVWVTEGRSADEAQLVYELDRRTLAVVSLTIGSNHAARVAALTAQDGSFTEDTREKLMSGVSVRWPRR